MNLGKTGLGQVATFDWGLGLLAIFTRLFLKGRDRKRGREVKRGSGKIGQSIYRHIVLFSCCFILNPWDIIEITTVTVSGVFTF